MIFIGWRGNLCGQPNSDLGEFADLHRFPSDYVPLSYGLVKYY